MPVQAAAADAAKGRQGYSWFLEQGLGKGPLALNEYIELFINDKVDYFVVICPPSFKEDWVDIVSDWVATGPDGRPVMDMVSWPKKPLEMHGRRPTGIAMNYEAMRTSGGEVIRALCARYRVYLVFDESSEISNAQSTQTKRAIDLGKECRANGGVMRNLNGTPQVRDFTDYWSQMRAVGNWDGINIYHFRNRYGIKGGFKGKKILGVDPDMQDQLNALIARDSFRALKVDWAPWLPPKLAMPPRRFEMTKQQLAAYREMYEDFYTVLQDGSEVTAEIIITRQMRLQQIASGFVKTDEGDEVPIMPIDKNPKIQAVLQDAKNFAGKFIMVAHFRSSQAAIFEALEAEGYKPVALRGGMDARTMKDIKDEFNENDEVRTIVLPCGLGSMGHTLLGKPGNRCSATQFYENNYRLRDRLQIEDRNHRYGQDAEVVTYWDYAGSQAERDILKALQHKENMANAISEAIKRRPTLA